MRPTVARRELIRVHEPWVKEVNEYGYRRQGGLVKPISRNRGQGSLNPGPDDVSLPPQGKALRT